MKKLITKNLLYKKFFHKTNFLKKVEDLIIDYTKYEKFKNVSVYNNTEIDVDSQPNKTMNMFQAINDAMSISMEKNDKVCVFGEDVSFGGVFRCTMGLLEKFGKGFFYSFYRRSCF
jgi:hypothetical protein